MHKAVTELVKIASNGGNILFVGTKKQAKEIIQKVPPFKESWPLIKDLI